MRDPSQPLSRGDVTATEQKGHGDETERDREDGATVITKLVCTTAKAGSTSTIFF